MREIADVGLNICLELIENISRSDTNVANFFYQQYLLNLVQDVFFVLTDTDHKSGMNNYLYNGYIQLIYSWLMLLKIPPGFKYQAMVLARIFHIVESGAVQAPLFNPAEIGDPSMTNQRFLREYVMTLLRNAFPHLQKSVSMFVLCI